MSMTIRVEAHGDCDRLPHKDLLEHIIREINAAVGAAVGEQRIANLPVFTPDHGTEVRVARRIRPLSGSEPYIDWGESVEVCADWTVHLPDPE